MNAPPPSTINVTIDPSVPAQGFTSLIFRFTRLEQGVERTCSTQPYNIPLSGLCVTVSVPIGAYTVVSPLGIRPLVVDAYGPGTFPITGEATSTILTASPYLLQVITPTPPPTPPPAPYMIISNPLGMSPCSTTAVPLLTNCTGSPVPSPCLPCPPCPSNPTRRTCIWSTSCSNRCNNFRC